METVAAAVAMEVVRIFGIKTFIVRPLQVNFVLLRCFEVVIMRATYG